jgi:hypothetical protein
MNILAFLPFTFVIYGKCHQAGEFFDNLCYADYHCCPFLRVYKTLAVYFIGYILKTVFQNRRKALSHAGFGTFYLNYALNVVCPREHINGLHLFNAITVFAEVLQISRKS